MDLAPQRQTTDGPRPIHEAIRFVWLFSNCISLLVFAVLGSLFEFAMIRALHLPWSFPFIAPVLAILIGAFSLGMVKRQWSAWKYEVTTHEVILSWGVWWQTTRLVPRDRIQHVDIKSGPLDRRFGLVHVGLYVAGAHGSVGSIPGLHPDEAESLRSMLVETQAEHV